MKSSGMINSLSVEQEVGGSSPPNCTSSQTDIMPVDTEASAALSQQVESNCSTLLASPSRFTHNSQINSLGEIMFAVRSGNFQLGLMLATALSVSVLPTTGQAYTPEQQAACSDDAFRLCSADIPDVDRITACMIRNRDQLTPGCRAYFKSSEPEPAVRAGMPLSIKPASSRKPVSAKQ